MAVADQILEAERGADSFRHTPLDAFRLHFQSLVDGKVCYELVGKLPDWRKDGPELPRDVFVYSGLDWMDGFKEALRRNIQGYNIFFTPKDAMGCLDFEWIGLSGLTDRTGDNAGNIIEHVLEMNVEEFSGKANVLDAGDRIWFQIKLPIRTAREMYEPTRLRKSIHRYCTNLGLKWNRIARNVFTFHIDNVDFFPGMNMPVAGLFNHNLKPSCRICWLDHEGFEPQPGVLIRILATKDPVNDMMKKYYGLDLVGVECNLPLLNFNPDFTVESLDRLLKKDDVARKIFEDDSCNGMNCDTIHILLGRVLDLRANFLAGLNTIERCLTRTGRLLSIGAGNSTGLQRSDILRMILAADEQIKSVRGAEKAGQKDIFQSKTKGFDTLSLLGNIDTIHATNVVPELSKKYGRNINVAHYGWYVFRIEGPPREIVQFRDDFQRTRSYLPLPCTFWISANKEQNGPGALLVPNSMANSFWDEACQIGTKKILVATYFWYFGRKYRLFGIPAKRTDAESWSMDEVERYAFFNFPEVLKLQKHHLKDRIRKGSIGENWRGQRISSRSSELSENRYYH